MTLPDPQPWLELPPYGLSRLEKERLLGNDLHALTGWHREHCRDYGRIASLMGAPGQGAIADVPFIPVRLFKEFDLVSVPREDIFKTMMSSGTSGQAASRIFLDRDTAALQTKILGRLMTDLLGPKRLPMLVIDSASILKNRSAFSARAAGVLGFSMFGQDVTYALDEHMGLDLAAIEAFLERHQGRTIFLFGFTFMVWRHFLLELEALGKYLPIPGGILLHGGGWKKLQDQAVGGREFGEALRDRTGLARVVNYYGMVEQTGSLFMECEAGHLHAPIFADLVIRDPRDFRSAEIGQAGLIEVLSMLPRSYPGHALLTEDMGVLLGEDDCVCGRLGKYFSVLGRVAKAEIRGCSDTYDTPP